MVAARRVAGDVMMVVCGGESERRDEEAARGKNSACVRVLFWQICFVTQIHNVIFYIKKNIN
jgi:hypothetical protein